MEMYSFASEAAVNWSSYIRDVMCEQFKRNVDEIRIGGPDSVVEIDESLFGRKFKYNKGARKGTHVWIFGMVNRTNGRVMLWPVNDRKEETLVPLIKKFVAPGTAIYSDGWASYCNLSEHGYDHWVVNHKEYFKVVIKRGDETREVHTNRIEGYWGNCKSKLKSMRGTSAANFISHLIEMIYRSHHQEDHIIKHFFDDLYLVYPLNGKPVYINRQLFDIDVAHLDVV